MLLLNVSVLGGETVKNILIKDGIIHSVSPFNPTIEHNEKKPSLLFSDAMAFPGLINSHDHLDFNLFPLLKNRIYNNYREWGNDIHDSNKTEITKALQVPQNIRIQWGIYKNLLNGF